MCVGVCVYTLDFLYTKNLVNYCKMERHSSKEKRKEKKRREDIDTDIVRSESFGMSVAFVIDYAAAVDEVESIQ